MARISYAYISGDLDENGMLNTGLWFNDIIPIHFQSVNRYGWNYNFSNDVNNGQIFLYVTGITSVATGYIEGILHYIHK